MTPTSYLSKFSLNFSTQPKHRCTSRAHLREARTNWGPTFSSLAFMVDVMVVGLMNWKEGAALLGYCAGNFTSILTRWLLQCTDTVQLLSAASICKTQAHNCFGGKLQRVFRYKWIFIVIFLVFWWCLGSNPGTYMLGKHSTTRLDNWQDANRFTKATRMFHVPGN